MGIRSYLSTSNTIDGARLLRNIGLVKRKGGDIEGQRRAVNKALRILIDQESLTTKLGITVLTDLGDANEALNDMDLAVDAYQHALQLRQEMGMLESLAGAALLDRIGA